MRANPPNHIKISPLFLKGFFHLRWEHLLTMVAFIMVILKERTTNVHALSLSVFSHVLAASEHKRLLRFLDKVTLDPKGVISCICTILNIDFSQKLTLIMDNVLDLWQISSKFFISSHYV